MAPSRLAELDLPEVTVGCGRLGAFWQGRGVLEGRSAVLEALCLGIRSFDTADVYARGISERLIGNAIKGLGDAIVVTKVGQLKTVSGLARAGLWRRPAALTKALRRTDVLASEGGPMASW